MMTASTVVEEAMISEFLRPVHPRKASSAVL